MIGCGYLNIKSSYRKGGHYDQCGNKGCQEQPKPVFGTGESRGRNFDH
jgi:hypothetical protein